MNEKIDECEKLALDARGRAEELEVTRADLQKQKGLVAELERRRDMAKKEIR